MSKLEELFEAVRYGRFNDTPALVQEALDEGCAPLEILNDGMIAAMDLVGDLFKKDQLYVPEMLIAAMAMKAGVEVLRPHLASESGAKKGKMVMGTVYGDLHDIGKNFVIMMIESAGFEVVDLGIDVPVQNFVDAVENDPEVSIVGVSALLTTTMPTASASPWWKTWWIWASTSGRALFLRTTSLRSSRSPAES